MDKFVKAVLTVISLCVLSLPVKAEEKVLYCEMKNFRDLSPSADQAFVLERFKIKITPVAVQFGKGGYTDDIYQKMTFYNNYQNWNASTNGITKIMFYEGIMTFVLQGSDRITAFVATCEDF